MTDTQLSRLKWIPGFPKWVQVETAAVAESEVIDHQAAHLMQHFRPGTVTTDNSYAKARRIRQWAKHGIVLLIPAVKWVKGRYATAYHRYIQQPENAELLQSRRTAIEPVFDLIAHSLGITAMQKQSDTPGKAGGLMSGTASKAVGCR